MLAIQLVKKILYRFQFIGIILIRQISRVSREIFFKPQREGLRCEEMIAVCSHSGILAASSNFSLVRDYQL